MISTRSLSVEQVTNIASNSAGIDNCINSTQSSLILRSQAEQQIPTATGKALKRKLDQLPCHTKHNPQQHKLQYISRLADDEQQMLS